jgi:hypothetical protein
MMRMADPLARQPLVVGAALAALALTGAATAPNLAAIGLAIAVPFAMVAYSALAASRGTAADRLETVAIEAANAGLRREIVGSLQALVSDTRADQAADERRYLDLVRSWVQTGRPEDEAAAVAPPAHRRELAAPAGELEPA